MPGARHGHRAQSSKREQTLAGEIHRSRFSLHQATIRPRDGEHVTGSADPVHQGCVAEQVIGWCRNDAASLRMVAMATGQSRPW
jgi:hypothetical protein